MEKFGVFEEISSKDLPDKTYLESCVVKFVVGNSRKLWTAEACCYGANSRIILLRNMTRRLKAALRADAVGSQPFDKEEPRE